MPMVPSLSSNFRFDVVTEEDSLFLKFFALFSFDMLTRSLLLRWSAAVPVSHMFSMQRSKMAALAVQE